MPEPLQSRERVLAAMRREPVDYVPCCGAFNPLYPAQRRGHTWGFPWPPEAALEEQVACQVEQLGLDALVPVSLAPTLAYWSVGVARLAPGVKARTWREDGILHKAYATSAGELHAAIRYNDLWPHGENIPFYDDFNIGHFVEPWIRDAGDLECWRSLWTLPEPDEVVAAGRESLQRSQALAGTYGLATIAAAGMGLTGAMQLFGATELCLAAVDQPELVDAYLEWDHRLSLRAMQVLGLASVDIVRRNGFYETADFYSPAMLEHFLGDRLRAEATSARQAGLATTYLAHTGVMPILDHLAALPFDSVTGIDIAHPGTDLARIRDRLAASKALWTGPSSTHHIWKGAQATRQAVREVFECLGRRGFILTQCVSSHSIMPWESTLAMIDEWKKLR
ncbi:MAG: hypothetical protein AB1505_34785 [Candidatus Latescibacterota bacterium]